MIKSSYEKRFFIIAETFNTICITSVTSTVCRLFGIETPADIAESNNFITSIAEKKLASKTIDRAVLYNPDAVALWLYQKYTEKFTDAAIRSDLAIPMLSVMPSVTPVCFASMYTGVMPDVHGIKKYEKPVHFNTPIIPLQPAPKSIFTGDMATVIFFITFSPTAASSALNAAISPFPPTDE